MSKNLRTLAKQQGPEVVIDPAAHAFRPPPPRRGVSWRTIGFGLAAVFALYVFGGHFVLRPELQWSTVSGQIFGRQGAAATTEGIPAKAAEAAAVTGASEGAKVDPAVLTASGVAWAKVEPEATLYARNKQADVQAQRQISDIQVEQRSREAKIEADKVARVKAGEAYQDCLARAAEQGRSAVAARSSQANATAGALEAAGAVARMQAEALCEQRKADEEAARAEAEASVKR